MSVPPFSLLQLTLMSCAHVLLSIFFLIVLLLFLSFFVFFHLFLLSLSPSLAISSPWIICPLRHCLLILAIQTSSAPSSCLFPLSFVASADSDITLVSTDLYSLYWWIQDQCSYPLTTQLIYLPFC